MANSLQWITSGPNILADFWFDVEFDAAAGAATTTQLEASDHYAPTSITSIVDTGSLLSTSTSGEQHTISSVQVTADAGTRGLAISLASATDARWRWFFTGAIRSSYSHAFWFKGDTLASGNSYDIDLVADANVNYCTFTSYRHQASPDRYQILLWAGGDFGYAVVTPGNWYWITTKYVQAGVCQAACYDSTGAAQTIFNSSDVSQGTSISITDTNNRFPDLLRIGNLGPAASDSGKILYIDDVCVSWSGGTVIFPFGP